jgi:hypothetical protein
MIGFGARRPMVASVTTNEEWGPIERAVERGEPPTPRRSVGRHQPTFCAPVAGSVLAAPKAGSAGRICAADGCDTVLSRYNSLTCCALHTESPTFGHARGV